MSDLHLILQWAVAVVVGLALLARRQLTLYHPATVYLAFHVAAFCLRPTLVHLLDLEFAFRHLDFTPRPGHLQLALVVSSVGLVVFCLACSLAGPGQLPAEPGGEREPDPVDRRALYWTGAVFVPLGLYSALHSDVLGSWVNDVFVAAETTGLLPHLHLVLLPVTVLFILVNRWRPWSFVPFIAYLLHLLGRPWGRWAVLLAVFALLLVWLWDHRRRVPPLWSCLVPPLLFSALVLLAPDRSALMVWLRGERSARSTITRAQPDARERLDSLDLANFDALTHILATVPGESSHSHGAQYLRILTQAAPREAGRNRAERPASERPEAARPGLPVSLVGDGWITGGWPGLVVTMAVAGAGMGFAHRWFIRYQHHAAAACAFLLCSAVIVQVYRDGGVPLARLLLGTTLPVLLWGFLSRRMHAMAAATAHREELREARFRRLVGAPSASADDAEDEASAGEEELDGPGLDREDEEERPGSR